MNFTKKWPFKVVVFAIATILAVLITRMTPPEGYTEALTQWIGIFLWMIILMVFQVFADWLVMLIGLAVCCLVNIGDFSTVFSAFSSTTIWSIIALTGFISSLVSTGLFKRVALKILTFFKPDYTGQILAVGCAGTILAPVVPSVISKFGILQPVAASISQAGGYANKSKPAAGLFSATFVPAWILSFAFMSGTPTVYMLIGYLGDSGAKWNWGNWFLAALPWFAVTAVGMLFFILKYYKPKDAAKLTAEQIEAGKATAKENYKALGPLSGTEKFAAAVLIICVVFWITESLHGIPAIYVSFAGWAAVTIKGLFGPRQFGTAIPWMVVVLSGLIIGIITCCTITGFNDWVSGIVAPVLGSLAGNVFVMVPLICVVTYVLRLFLVPNTATLIVYAAFAPVMAASGVDPWFIVFVSYMAGLCWTTKFTSVAPIQALAFAPGMVDWKDIQPTSFAYMVVNIIALFASIPVWSLMGIV